MTANAVTKSTAHVGVRFELSRRQRLWPGMAPSRENANDIREALVRHATPQNSCAMTAMRITALAAAEVSAVVKIGSALAFPFMASGLFAAKVTASSRIQPKSAERHTPLAAESAAFSVSSERWADAS